MFKEKDLPSVGAILSECHSSLLVTQSHISLNSSVRDNIKFQYENDARWANIVAEIKSDQQKNLVNRGVKDF